ncbi:glycosyltransferase family 4 protein [Pedobacter agri]|uniref:glycosyltransferase family 4 protein n=1 Tax=Pedobacter agri TaxID=454586 RepID=UPI00029A75CC|nr:glycosyltransferase family 4 protein [Pedobacter agri]
MLEGYNYEFLTNIAKDPGSHHYIGIDNPDLKAVISRFSPDAILIYGWAYKSHLSTMRYFKGKIPLWFRGDSTLIDEKRSFKDIARTLFLKWVYKNIDKAFYVGSANKAYFEKFGLKPGQLKFAPHAIDNDRFVMDRFDETQTLRNKLGIVDGEILVLFAGKLERKKSPDLLSQAFLELNTNDVHLLFVGNGELEEQLKALALRQAQGDNKIHFIDFQNQTQMPLIYQACNLFVLPSQGPGETWGLAVNEAMAAGRAVLVSDKVGCASDLVYRGQNGDIFRSNDLNDLKSKLSKLLSDPSKLEQMGIKSKHIISDWNIDKQVRIFLKTLND